MWSIDKYIKRFKPAKIAPTGVRNVEPSKTTVNRLKAELMKADTQEDPMAEVRLVKRRAHKLPPGVGGNKVVVCMRLFDFEIW